MDAERSAGRQRAFCNGEENGLGNVRSEARRQRRSTSPTPRGDGARPSSSHGRRHPGYAERSIISCVQGESRTQRVGRKTSSTPSQTFSAQHDDGKLAGRQTRPASLTALSADEARPAVHSSMARRMFLLSPFLPFAYVTAAEHMTRATTKISADAPRRGRATHPPRASSWSLSRASRFAGVGKIQTASLATSDWRGVVYPSRSRRDARDRWYMATTSRPISSRDRPGSADSSRPGTQVDGRGAARRVLRLERHIEISAARCPRTGYGHHVVYRERYCSATTCRRCFSINAIRKLPAVAG